MATATRIVIPGAPHHVTQRGNRGQTVFVDDEDRMKFLDILSASLVRYRVRLPGFCLMSNHFHLLGIPRADDSLTGLMRKVESRYAIYFNMRHNYCGHLFQGPFWSTPMDRHHFWNALVYIERNPVHAGITDFAGDYAWSSAMAHAYPEVSPPWVDLTDWRSEWSSTSWDARIRRGDEDDRYQEALESARNEGRPLVAFPNNIAPASVKDRRVTAAGLAALDPAFV